MSATHLGNCDAALLGQLLLGLLARVRVAEVRVEVLVEDFRRLLAEVSPFPPEWGNKKNRGERGGPKTKPQVNRRVGCALRWDRTNRAINLARKRRK